MRKILTGILIFTLTLCLPLFAEVTVLLDNEHIQEYRGKVGKWMRFATKNQLDAEIARISTTLPEVLRVNGTDNIRGLIGSYSFIPYSEKYCKDLEAGGIKRESITCKEDQFIWPVKNVALLTSVFGIRWGKLHEGLDMPSPRGTIVRAVKSGKVVSVGYAGGYGKEIRIEHRNNFITRYAHNSVNYVKEGDFVKQGQVIGLVGSSGNSTGSHLHFEIRSNGIPLDPLDLLPENELLHVNKSRLKNWK